MSKVNTYQFGNTLWVGGDPLPIQLGPVIRPHNIRSHSTHQEFAFESQSPSDEVSPNQSESARDNAAVREFYDEVILSGDRINYSEVLDDFQELKGELA